MLSEIKCSNRVYAVNTYPINLQTLEQQKIRNGRLALGTWQGG